MKKYILALGVPGLFLSLLLLVACGANCLHLHKHQEVIAPSCDSEGYTLNSCYDCGKQYKTDVISPTGHTLSATVTEPTCDEQGYTTYVCSCGYKYIGSFVSPVGHVYELALASPTCEKAGYTVYSCLCGYFYVGGYVEPDGHAYVETIVSPDCDSEGYVERTCSVCEHSYRTEIRPPLGHDYTATVTPPTCTEAGYTDYVCAREDSTYRSDFIAPLGHALTVTSIIHPTATKPGQITQECTQCAQVFTATLQYADVYSNAYATSSVPLAKGVDVSYHNHDASSEHPSGYAPLNWSAIKAAGFDFAILRAGYPSFHDPVFEMNYADAKAAGLDVGVYYYTYADTVEEARAEAEELIGWLAGKQFEYPIYYDLEDDRLAALGKELLAEICITFIDTLRQAGYYGALYSNNNWLVNYLNSEDLKTFCELWYARYPRDPVSTSDSFAAFVIAPDDDHFVWLESYGAQVGMWQFTQCGRIEGYATDRKIDFNYAFKDYPTLMKTFCLNGYTPSVSS